MMTQSNPPLQHHYGILSKHPPQQNQGNDPQGKECQLPLIDLRGLNSCDKRVQAACAAAIYRASSEWGFFQVVNHGISPELLREMRKEQMKLFRTPFERKSSCGLLNNSYRWGTPTATCPEQFSWSEAFHCPLTKVSDLTCYGEFTTLSNRTRIGSLGLSFRTKDTMVRAVISDQVAIDREVMMEFAEAMSKLSRLLAGVLAESLGHPRGVFDKICNESTCFLRLNRYPICPVSPDIFGFVPHTDSDFLTILYQDEVGGLQLMKDSQWVAVRPNQDALIVNIGDLFQAWSNDTYKSVEHRVMVNGKRERYSVAYFLCPSYDSLIGSCREPSIYRKFTFGEYRSQVRKDVERTGHKVGLPRFRL